METALTGVSSSARIARRLFTCRHIELDENDLYIKKMTILTPCIASKKSKHMYRVPMQAQNKEN
jgi:hypothetical protein